MSDKTFSVIMGCVGLVLFSIHAHADYLLQAFQHGWWSWLDLSYRAPAVPWYQDIIARDLWHAVQFIRNQTVIVATMCAVGSAIGLVPKFKRAWIETALYFLSPFIFYALTRAVFFSLAKELLN